MSAVNASLWLATDVEDTDCDRPIAIVIWAVTSTARKNKVIAVITVLIMAICADVNVPKFHFCNSGGLRKPCFKSTT